MRAFILVLDSFGIGASLDAHTFGDAGADTFGHIADECAAGRADKEGVRHGPISLPNLNRLGLGFAACASTGKNIRGFSNDMQPTGKFGYAVEQSRGKDTPSGHWEMAGVPVMFDWGYFPQTIPCFPDKLIQALIQEGQIPGILGNRHASGTVIVEELGEEHIRSGKPIVYTSADSVLQIAAHEESFGLPRLYALCEIARKLVDEYHIGRVIARPFIGTQGKFTRTGNRRDYATPPPSLTLLNYLNNAGREVISIGKVSDIFAHQGITQKIKAHGNMVLFDKTLEAAQEAPEGSLIFTNFVDFDTEYGHRRDVVGYANALELFDKQLPRLEKMMRPGDVAIITADHGCDPTFPGTDHTREHIPVIAFGPQIEAGFIGRRETFADIGQSIAKHLEIAPLDFGLSFL